MIPSNNAIHPLWLRSERTWEDGDGEVNRVIEGESDITISEKTKGMLEFFYWLFSANRAYSTLWQDHPFIIAMYDTEHEHEFKWTVKLNHAFYQGARRATCSRGCRNSTAAASSGPDKNYRRAEEAKEIRNTELREHVQVLYYNSTEPAFRAQGRKKGGSQ